MFLLPGWIGYIKSLQGYRSKDKVTQRSQDHRGSGSRNRGSGSEEGEGKKCKSQRKWFWGRVFIFYLFKCGDYGLDTE